MTDDQRGTTITYMRDHVYEIVSNSDSTPKVLATFWWDGKKVQCDNEQYLEYANDRSPNNYSSSSGVKFLEALPLAFKNGYLTCRRAKNSD